MREPASHSDSVKNFAVSSLLYSAATGSSENVRNDRVRSLMLVMFPNMSGGGILKMPATVSNMSFRMAATSS